MTKEYNLYRMNKSNRFMVLVVAFFIAILTVFSSSCVPALAKSLEDEEGVYLAEIPRVIESSKEDYVESFLENQTEDYVPLPVRYMRNMKPVYDQRTSNTCWAFAGVSLFEFAVERKVGNGKIFSFSAEHLVEKTSSMGKCGFTASIKEGGTESMVSSYFVSGYGPVSATDYPWRDDYYLIPDYSFGKAEYRATDIKYYLNERNSDGTLSSNINQSVKEDVFYNGAVYFSMYMPNDSSLWAKYLGSDGKSYYVNDKKYTENNHAVLVVGWDDNYSKTNFKSKPKADGAWLVRNSWGPNVGDKGYYWVSYEDTVIIPQITICGYEEMDEFKKVYNLDESGMSGELEYNTTEGGFINVFDIDNNEKITEVTFFESSTTASYQIFYVPIKSDGIPDVSKKIALSEEKNIEYKGYHTVPIKQQIELNPGTKYGIMVYIRDRNKVSIGIEMTSNHTRATLNEGESFWCNKAGIITDEKSYGNAAWGNFSIKLVTVTPVSIFNTYVYGNPVTYTGSEIIYKPTIKFNGITLTEGEDYIISYSNNVNVGHGTMKITGINNFTETRYISFIIKEADISNATVANISTQTYTGSAITPKPRITFNNITLKEGIDYNLSYSNNTEVGTATITIIGIGNFTGTTSRTFSIK